jgi:hypothetical protein
VKTHDHAKAINEETHVNRGIGQRGIFWTQSAAATLNRSAKAEPFEGIPNMIRERIADTTEDFEQNSLGEANATKINPPAVLITPAMIDQMRERRRQREALKAWAAGRQTSEESR